MLSKYKLLIWLCLHVGLGIGIIIALLLRVLFAFSGLVFFAGLAAWESRVKESSWGTHSGINEWGSLYYLDISWRTFRKKSKMIQWWYMVKGPWTQPLSSFLSLPFHVALDKAYDQHRNGISREGSLRLYFIKVSTQIIADEAALWWHPAGPWVQSCPSNLKPWKPLFGNWNGSTTLFSWKNLK